MNIALGADHAGYQVKERIAGALRSGGHDIADYGTCDETPVDYPQFGYAVGEAVASGQCRARHLGVRIESGYLDGSKQSSRRALRGRLRTADPELSRRHNDANVLALSERLTGWEMLERIVQVFLTTPFDGGRHAWRVEQLFEYGDAQRERTLKALERGSVTDAQTPAEFLKAGAS